MCRPDDQHGEQRQGCRRRIGVGLLQCLPGAEVAKVQSEEPGAAKLHAGICAGASGSERRYSDAS